MASASRVEEVPGERLEADAEKREIGSGVSCSVFYATRFAALISLVAASPAMVFALSVLVIPFERAFHTSRMDSSSTASFAWTAQFVMSLPASWCFRRFPASYVMVLGAALSVGGCVLSATTATTMFQVHVFLGGLSGMGQGILCSLACFLIPVYFPSRVSFANGVVYGVGNGVGTLAWSFGLEALLQEFGWRWAVLLTSAASLAFLVLPLCVLVTDYRRSSTSIVADKLRREMNIDSKRTAFGAEMNRNLDKQPASLSFGAFMFTRNAIMVAISYSAFCLSTLGIFGHLSAQVQNLGMSSHVGAVVVSAAGFAGMAVRPAWGFLADRHCGKRTLLFLLATLLSVLFLVWNICSTPETAILFGCALGVLFNAFYTVLAGLIWDVGGERHFNNFYSVLNSVFGLPGCMFSSVLYGMVYNYQGNYWIAGFGGSALMMISAVSPLFVRLPRHSSERSVKDVGSTSIAVKKKKKALCDRDTTDAELSIVVL